MLSAIVKQQLSMARKFLLIQIFMLFSGISGDLQPPSTVPALH
jgi:hypothetical protein